MNEKELEGKIESVLKEILTTIRLHSTATTEVGSEKSLNSVELIRKLGLKELGVEE
jgi:hypothetical protein